MNGNAALTQLLYTDWIKGSFSSSFLEWFHLIIYKLLYQQLVRRIVKKIA